MYLLKSDVLKMVLFTKKSLLIHLNKIALRNVRTELYNKL